MTAHETGLALYDRAARRGAAQVISQYSTSFGLASRLLLGARCGSTSPNIYALVRIADEIVDGPAEEAGLDACAQPRPARRPRGRDRTRHRARLQRQPRRARLRAAPRATTGIGVELTRPFFASMRTRPRPGRLRRRGELRSYIYGSAEVVGLMCLRVFLCGLTVDAAARRALGARRAATSARPSRRSTSCATSPTTSTPSVAATFPESTRPGSARPARRASSTTSTPTSRSPAPSSPSCRGTAAAPSPRPTPCSRASPRECAAPPASALLHDAGARAGHPQARARSCARRPHEARRPTA